MGVTARVYWPGATKLQLNTGRGLPGHPAGGAAAATGKHDVQGSLT